MRDKDVVVGVAGFERASNSNISCDKLPINKSMPKNKLIERSGPRKQRILVILHCRILYCDNCSSAMTSLENVCNTSINKYVL